DVIARVDVRSKFRFVLAAQSACHFAGDTSEDFVRRVNHEPVALDLVAFGGKGFHDDFLKKFYMSKWWFRPMMPSADAALLSLSGQTKEPEIIATSRSY